MITTNIDLKNKITNACLLIMNNEIDFIEGCRILASLRTQYDLGEDPDFSPFVGVVSETDDYPQKNIRVNFSKDCLTRIDAEVADYVSRVRPSITEACSVLLAKYSEKIQKG